MSNQPKADPESERTPVRAHSEDHQVQTAARRHAEKDPQSTLKQRPQLHLQHAAQCQRKPQLPIARSAPGAAGEREGDTAREV